MNINVDIHLYSFVPNSLCCVNVVLEYIHNNNIYYSYNVIGINLI